MKETTSSLVKTTRNAIALATGNLLEGTRRLPPQNVDLNIDRIFEMENEYEESNTKLWYDTQRVMNPSWDVKSILPILEVGGAVSSANGDMGGSWPRDFYEALIRPDWRLWVEAVKSEMDSWIEFQACEEVPYENVDVGASVIPLGELFTI